IVCIYDRLDLSNDDDSLFSQAVQIILTLFHYALGALSASLFFEEDIKNTGEIPVLLPLGYIVWSSPFFLISGSMAVSAQKKPTRYKLAGGMLLQYLLFSSVTELIVVSIIVSWIVQALHHPASKEE
ncbi:hypothetical protein Celaphus_00013464, partial [Cervus elaphus hippelaphus]